VHLWSKLPSDSLAPLAKYVWNTDPKLFQPDSPEVNALSDRLGTDHSRLASLVKGVIPHPQGTKRDPASTSWRSPIWTSKCDLEVHVFTTFSGETPGQPNFPHFDRSLLRGTPMEAPYLH
jgi:spatacsin